FHEMGELDREVLDSNIAKAMALIRHMSSTIDDFRGFFRPDKEMVEFRVDEAVTKALDLVRDSFQELRIEVEIDCPKPVVAKGFANEYAQVLLNILINARDAFESHKVDRPQLRIGI